MLYEGFAQNSRLCLFWSVVVAQARKRIVQCQVASHGLCSELVLVPRGCRCVIAFILPLNTCCADYGMMHYGYTVDWKSSFQYVHNCLAWTTILSMILPLLKEKHQQYSSFIRFKLPLEEKCRQVPKTDIEVKCVYLTMCSVCKLHGELSVTL